MGNLEGLSVKGMNVFSACPPPHSIPGSLLCMQRILVFEVMLVDLLFFGQYGFFVARVRFRSGPRALTPSLLFTRHALFLGQHPVGELFQWRFAIDSTVRDGRAWQGLPLVVLATRDDCVLGEEGGASPSGPCSHGSMVHEIDIVVKELGIWF